MIRVKVGTVDPYGFCGRENHPLRTDSSKVGTLVSSERFEVEGEDGQLRRQANGTEDEDSTVMLTALTVEFEDGRVVELIEHEVESITVVNE